MSNSEAIQQAASEEHEPTDAVIVNAFKYLTAHLIL